VLVLANHWDDFGGARAYAAWAGLRRPRTGDPRFDSAPALVAHDLAHLEVLLSRRNAFDGHRTGGHPAVLALELVNEPRLADRDGGGPALRGWVDEVGARVRQLAPGPAGPASRRASALPASWPSVCSSVTSPLRTVPPDPAVGREAGPPGPATPRP
jgi:hypothetical protein